MSGLEAIYNLEDGWELHISDLRAEGEGEQIAIVGEVAIRYLGKQLSAETLPITLNHFPSITFFTVSLVQDYPDRPDLLRQVEFIAGILDRVGHDPGLGKETPALTRRRIYQLSEGNVLAVWEPRTGMGGHPRAWAERLDRDGDLIPPRIEMVFDEGPAARYTRTLLNLTTSYLATIEHDVVADIAAMATPSSRIIRSGDIELAEPAWLIEEILPRTGLTLLVGKEASYKSFAAQGIAAAILTGLPWVGHEVQQGTVLYLAGEGQAGIKRRIRAWEIAHGLSLDEFLVLPLPVNFLDNGALAALETEIGALDPAPVLIVVDTLARYYGGDENATADMGHFVEACDRLKRSTGAQVVIVHHLNKSGEFRGSTALVAAVDTRIDAKRDEMMVELRCAKQKDWEEFAPVTLAAHPIEIGIGRGGNPVTSLVLQPADAEQLRAVKHAAATRQPLSTTEQTVLAILRATSGPLTAGEWQTAAAIEGIARATFYRARDQLAVRGLINLDGEGKGARYSPVVISPTLVSYRSHEPSPGRG